MEGFDQPPPAGAQAPMQAKSSLNADPHSLTHASIHTTAHAHSRTASSTSYGDGGLGGWQMRWRGSVRARGRWARRGTMAAGEDGGGDDNGNGSDGK